MMVRDTIKVVKEKRRSRGSGGLPAKRPTHSLYHPQQLDACFAGVEYGCQSEISTTNQPVGYLNMKKAVIGSSYKIQ